MRKNISLDDNLVKKVDEYCAENNYGLSELVAELLRHRIMGVDIVKIPDEPTQIVGIPIEVVKNSPKTVHLEEQKLVEKKVYDELWEDWNFMPVKKERLDPGFCVEWHGKGVTRPLYEIKKFRVDGSLEKAGRYCRECVERMKKEDGHLE